MVIFCVFLIVSCNTPPQGTPGDNCEHDLISVAPKFPTCSENGYTSHQICTKCNYSTKVEALANGVHEFDKSGICVICGTENDSASEFKEEISYYTYVHENLVSSYLVFSKNVPYTSGICTGEINYHKSYFDDNGHCLKKDNYSLFDRLLSTEIFFYDENGNETFSKFIDPEAEYTGIDPSAYSETHHQRNDDGSYSETSYSYDSEGQIAEENYSFYNADGVCLTYTVKIIKSGNPMFQNSIMTYKYDTKGNLISYQFSDITGDFSSLTQYTYDKNDNLTLVTLDGDVILENTYNEDGFISLKIEKENGEITNKTTYDSYGNITAIYPMNLSDPSITYENEYSNGDLVSKTITYHRKDGNHTSKTEFEYERDTTGELIRYKIINYSYENDEFVFNNYIEYYNDGTYSAKNLFSYIENARKTNENGMTKSVCKKEQRINNGIIWKELLYNDKYLLEWKIDYDSDGNVSSKSYYEYNEDRQKIKETVYDADSNVVDEIEFTYSEA